MVHDAPPFALLGFSFEGRGGWEGEVAKGRGCFSVAEGKVTRFTVTGTMISPK